MSSVFDPAKIRHLLILAAMEVEERALLKGVSFRSVPIHPRLNLHIKEFEIGDCSMKIAQSGVGIVNAALAVALISEKYPLDAIVLLGVGGAVSGELNPGDLVIASKIIQHDSFASQDDKRALIAAGELYLSKAPEKRLTPMIETDPTLTKWIHSYAQPNAKVGTVLSGSEFVGSYARKLELANLDSDALLVDMEAGGVAQMARRLSIPFAVAKTVADRFRPGISMAEDYQTFLREAADHAGEVLRLLTRTFTKHA